MHTHMNKEIWITKNDKALKCEEGNRSDVASENSGPSPSTSRGYALTKHRSSETSP